MPQKNVKFTLQPSEHLNRALILEREAAEKFGYEEVNVVPQPKAGGSFSTAAYKAFEEPVAVEHIKAHAGMDIRHDANRTACKLSLVTDRLNLLLRHRLQLRCIAEGSVI